jgi:hypothetical protein
MASLAHIGVGLAAKRIAPKVPVIFLILAAEALDLIFGVFVFLKMEHMPAAAGAAPVINPWSHGLFMAAVWSLIFGVITMLIIRNSRTSLIIGLLVFSHWVIDFISHPMTYVFPGDAKLPIFFEGSPLVGLGLWNSALAVNIGEYGMLAFGVIIYIFALIKIRNGRKRAQVNPI